VSIELTEKQKKFLEVLFEEAEGNAAKAIKLAGYAKGVRPGKIVGALEDEIFELTKRYFSQIAPKAAFAMSSAISDPTQLGLKEKMAAAKDMLDRAGLSKTDKVEVTASGGVFVLPAKESNDEEDKT
jgi:hypothetical protein